MNAVFQNIDEYLTELRTVGKDKASVVRVSAEEVNLAQAQQGEGGNGSGIQFVVVSGFHDASYFYQGMFDAGTATGRSDSEQRNNAAKMVAAIRAACGEIGVECRGGLWQRM